MDRQSSNGSENEPKSVAFSKLLLRPIRQPYEGRLGYMKRVASENSLSRSMMSQVAINIGDPRDIHFPDQIIGKKSWNFKYSRYCPMCLATNPIWRIEWELKHFDACPIHSCWLIDVCSKCGRHLLWARRTLLLCDCNMPLTEIAAEPCSLNVIAIAVAILRKLNNSLEEPRFPVIGHLQICDIQKVVKLIGYDGHKKERLESVKKKFSLSPERMEESRKLTEFCGEVLAAWPESFYKSLAAREQEYRMTSKENRLAKCFGTFYTKIYRNLEGTHFDFIREAFSSYLVLNWRGAIADRNTRLDPITRSGTWLPGNQACRELSISPKRLEKMIIDGEIDGYTYTSEKSARTRTYVNRVDFDNKKLELASSIDLQEATQLLGLSKNRMVELRPLLFPLAERLFASKKSQWSIRRSCVDRILEVSKSLLSCKCIDRNQVTLKHIVRYWKLGSNNIAQLIEAVASGDIKPTSVLSPNLGICSWIFCKDEIILYIGKLEKLDTTSITVRELASLLHIKQEVAYFLVRHQFVESYFSRADRIKQSRITLEALRKFLNTYVFLSDIAKRLNCSSRGLISRLHKFGICPVSGPTIDGCRKIIMHRTHDFESAINSIARGLGKDILIFSPQWGT